jgi:hypothetical protein
MDLVRICLRVGVQYLTHVVQPRQLLRIRDDLVTGSRVQPARGFIQEQDLGAGDELTRNADTSLLTTTDSLSDWGSNQCVCLILDTERFQQGPDTIHALLLRHGAIPGYISIHQIHKHAAIGKHTVAARDPLRTSASREQSEIQ